MNRTFDPLFDVPVRVTLVDNATEHCWQEEEAFFGTYWWTEGNGSCDCNRLPTTDQELDLEKSDPIRLSHCKGCQFAVIVAVEPLIEGYTLADFNQHYPPEVVEKAFDLYRRHCDRNRTSAATGSLRGCPLRLLCDRTLPTLPARTGAH